jgi:nicotinate (nicotinamide) nucleotide adenylyltransferase
MTRLAVAGRQGLIASRMEIDRSGVVYTVDTLEQLHRQFPLAQLNYIIGEDTLLELPGWREPDRIFLFCDFLVCRRGAASAYDHPARRDMEARGAKFTYLSLPPEDISSTAIREDLAQGGRPGALLPQIAEYIRIMGLYGVSPSPPEGERIYTGLIKALGERRMLHSVLVAHTARSLAQKHHLDETAAALAGLLHDCAKGMPLSRQQSLAKEHRLLLDQETLKSGNLLHGPVGAVIAQAEYGITDSNVLSAISCHTVGKVDMLPQDMALFLADKIEPSRRPYPGLDETRSLAEVSLVAATRYSLLNTLRYVQAQNTAPHPDSKRVADWLEQLENQDIARSETHE